MMNTIIEQYYISTIVEHGVELRKQRKVLKGTNNDQTSRKLSLFHRRSNKLRYLGNNE